MSPAHAVLAIPCTRCRALGHECDWVGRRDNRRRLSDRDARTLRQNIYGLEEKVKRLEEIIARHGLDGELDEVDEVGGSSEDVPDVNSVVSSFGRLVVSSWITFPPLSEHSFRVSWKMVLFSIMGKQRHSRIIPLPHPLSSIFPGIGINPTS